MSRLDSYESAAEVLRVRLDGAALRVAVLARRAENAPDSAPLASALLAALDAADAADSAYRDAARVAGYAARGYRATFDAGRADARADREADYSDAIPADVFEEADAAGLLAYLDGAADGYRAGFAAGTLESLPSPFRTYLDGRSGR